MKHSDYSLIPTFVAIVEERNYSKAAKRLGISQSAVSQSVTRLRDIFKDNLFTRGSHGVEPTPYAIDIYPALANSVESIAHMLPEQRHFNPAKCQRQFTIAALSVFSFTLFPQLSKRLFEQAPLASVKTEPLFGQDMISLLRTHQCDLLIEAESNRYPNLRSQVVMQDKLAVVCRAQHPRISGSEINLEQYLSEQHVIHSQPEQKFGYLGDMGIAGLTERRVAWQASGIMDMLPLIAQSDCMGILPERLASQHCQHFGLKPLHANFLPAQIVVSMYWHPSRTNDPAHRWLRDQCLLSGQT
ncbi:LysR family transcriptional regulator [Agarivorans sp. 1_MG-2023]|uniref:LysR family transcriptional regulator n=1 Tax=Agarivorans sp. 1_MG-2023 TaxID=3062634 RepID=UPI0026E474D8|nr:LysR family transcriptional regulator [Agarivorans sp. 1_MG-2023]MDO6764662.1 LysR family transcriptional regulator [Agarivorans sp. 1_MG-2023]